MEVLEKTMKILDVGCGIHKIKNADGIDFVDIPGLRYKHDLNVFPYPIKKDSYDFIYCSHTMEHLEDIQKVLLEFKRILKSHGKVLIKVPYISSHFAFQDPTHKHFFTYFTFDYFASNPAKHLELWYTLKLFKIKSKKLNFAKSGIRKLWNPFIERFANSFPIHYENLLRYIFPATELEILFEKP
jgi:ubiquinone/menaquinone biosynthesis C-methylase UbiE